MFCKHCGSEIKENQKFCNKCGTQLEEITTNRVPEKTKYNGGKVNQVKSSAKVKETKQLKPKMSKAKKIKIICFTVVLSLIIISASLITVFFTSPAYDVYKDLADLDYKAALSDYKSDIKDNFIQELLLKIALNGYGDKIINDFNNGKIKYDDAKAVLNAMNDMKLKNTQSFIDQLDKINNSQEAFSAANEFYSTGDYESAIREYSKITDTDSQYADAQTKLNEIYPKYIESVITQVNQMSSQGNHAGALSLINTAISIIPSSSSGVAELNQAKAGCLETYKKQIIDEITALIAEKKYVEAIESINAAIQIDDNEEFRNARTTAETEYVNAVTAAVNSFIEQEDYISADRNVMAALSILPQNTALLNLQKTVKASTPTYLFDVCKPYSVGDYEEYINGETFSMGGKSYTNGFKLYADEGYAAFNLENKYRQVNFSFGHVDQTRSDILDDNPRYAKIYLDGILKQEINLDPYAIPQKITLDVTGVSQMKIEMDGHYYYGDFGFGNIIVK